LIRVRVFLLLRKGFIEKVKKQVFSFKGNNIKIRKKRKICFSRLFKIEKIFFLIIASSKI